MAKVDKILVGLLSVICFAAVNCDKVPVLIWNDKITHSFPKVFSGHSIPASEFQKSFLDEIVKKNHNLVLFLQDKLSLDDITKYADVYNHPSDGDTFKNLKALMDSDGSVNLPNVDVPASTLSDLKQKFNGKVHDIHEQYTTKDLPLSSENNLLMVHLPETGSSDDQVKHSLRKIDEIIGKVSSELKSSGKPYTALYTASTNSHVSQDLANVGRHLLAEDTYTFINVSNCIYIYAADMSFNVDSSNWTLPAKPTVSGVCSSNSTTASVSMTYNDVPGGLTKLEMKIAFAIDSVTLRWKVTSWNASYSGKNESDGNKAFSGDGDEFAVSYIYAPLSFSYACGEPKITVLNSTDKEAGTTDVSLVVHNFQVQAFLIMNSEFGRDNNCIGFFSIGVWSMLVALFVLLIILVPGIQLLSSCKVMDRFDDPKGKTITVALGD